VTRPNVLVVVLDTVRARDTIPTADSPMAELAALADRGAEYAHAFSTAPWTVPSHGSLFTGTYPSRHGATGRSPALSGSLPTLAEAFRAGGYETVGVSNNTWVTGEFGFGRGFERFHRGWEPIRFDGDDGGLRRLAHPPTALRAVCDRLPGGSRVERAVEALAGDRLATGGAARTTSFVERWLDRRGDRPFFCFLNYIDAHIAYDPSRRHAERFLPADASYEEALAVRQEPRAFDVGRYSLSEREFTLLRALYRGELAALDEHIGRLRAALVAAGEWEETVLVVVGDHGENVGDHGFLGHQYDLHDTLLHVPLVVSGGAFDGWGDRDGLVQHVDLVPTLLDAAGLDAPALRESAQGRSIHPDATADADPREAVVAEYLGPQPSPDELEARFGRIPERVRRYDRTLRAVRTRDAKYVRGSDGAEWLYRVDDDPAETTDRLDPPDGTAVDADRRLARALDGRLDRWLDSVDPERADEAEADVTMTADTRQRLADLGYL
jgi:arylsulfatase A-like enzyme